MTKKILIIIFSVLILGAFAFTLSWGIINFNKVKEGMSGSGLYNKEDVDNAYKDGYNTALQDKSTYEELINGYRDTITTQSDKISQLNSQVVKIVNDNKDKQKTIMNLQNDKTNLENEVSNLETINTNNNITIEENNKQIAKLQNDLNNSEYENEQKLAQISSLQSINSSLQEANENNINTITVLNNQITSLNTQIVDLSSQVQFNGNTVTALNAKISQLESSIAYYEQYINSLENGEQVVATFEFDGSVYNVQILNKNSVASVVNPTSTEYVIFNGWTVNGETVDLNSYSLTASTKFVADVTYKYDVKFSVDNEVVNSQIVLKDSCAIKPYEPTKEDFDFLGWTLDGVNVIDVTTTKITANTLFVAKFALKQYDVKFMVDGSQYGNTQTIVIHNNANTPNTPTKTDYDFFGWTIDGTNVVDVSSYSITANTTFTAKFKLKQYQVKFISNGSQYGSTQTVEIHNKASVPTNPTKTDYNFVGWTIDGTNVVDVSSYSITANTTFIAKFTIKQYQVKFMVDGSQYGSTQTINIHNKASVPNVPNKSGFNFLGWTIDGANVVNVSNYSITGNTTFTAKFERGAGLFETGTNNVIYDWDYLINNNYLVNDNGSLKYGSNRSSLQALSGDLFISKSVTTILGFTFQDCKGLTGVIIPSSVTKVYGNAFRGCSGLASIKVDSLNTTFTSRDNSNKECNVIIEKSSNKLVIGCKNSIIPNNVVVIGTYAFYEHINLTNINISNSVTSIESNAFYGCKGLTSITIPSSVKSIGSSAFGNCRNLGTITMVSTQPPALDQGAISYISSTAEIRVPNSSLNTYKNASGWSNYASKMVGY